MQTEENKSYFRKKGKSHEWVLGVFFLNLVGGGLFLFLQIVNLSCDSAQPEVNPDDVSPHSRITVSLVDHTIHIRGCDFIRGTTERMKYGAAIGKDYQVCEHCFVESAEDEDGPDSRKQNERQAKSVIKGGS